jgi:K+-sensing histidine kinase KdpD
MSELTLNYNNRLEKEWIVLEFDETIHIEADLFMTKTILINLIENALKYAGTSQKLTLFLHKDNLNSKFGVKDLGPGISKEAQSDIFKKFVRLENEETRSQKGTGLGLFIAAEFTKLIGGKLQYIENQPNGAIFEITV